MPASTVCSYTLMLSIFAAIIGFIIKYSFFNYSIQHDYQLLNVEEVTLFQEFDKNHDLMISAEEFSYLYEAMQKKFYKAQTNLDEALDTELNEKNYDLSSDEVVRMQAEMEPLVLSTMSQTKNDPDFGSKDFAYSAEFDGLKKWKKVNIEKEQFFAKEFVGFLPLDKWPSIGKPYWIVSKSDSYMEINNTVYRPPSPISSREKLLHKLLLMFHSRPFLHMRFSPDGAVAVIRAQNDVYVEIQFRIHCEFQLNEYPRLPFWFTPSQFSGSLIISRDGSHVRKFKMHVPNDVKLNVDMEWKLEIPNDSNSSVEDEVDIGYLPLMRLEQVAPSSPVLLTNVDGSTLDRRELWKNDQDIHMEFDSISWSEEISVAAAKQEIDVVFYPFKKVKYFSFQEAFDHASREEKLVHQVVLWGALDDQSC